MRTLTEKQQKRRQRYLEAQVRNRWLWTALLSFNLFMSVEQIFEKHSQWAKPASLFQYPFHFGVPIMHSVWCNIFGMLIWSFALLELWLRIYNYRHDLLLAEQMALQKAAKPPEGVWPPPPVS